MRNDRVFEQRVGKCARCGKDHNVVTFKLFTQAVVDSDNNILYSHWGTCPETKDPILLRFVEVSDIK